MKSGTELFKNDEVRVWTPDGEVVVAAEHLGVGAEVEPGQVEVGDGVALAEVEEVATLGGDVTPFVAPSVLARLRARAAAR